MLVGSIISVLDPVVESGGSGIGSTVVSVLGIFYGFHFDSILDGACFYKLLWVWQRRWHAMPRICTAIILMYHGEISLTHMAPPHKPPSYFMR